MTSFINALQERNKKTDKFYTYFAKLKCKKNKINLFDLKMILIGSTVLLFSKITGKLKKL